MISFEECQGIHDSRDGFWTKISSPKSTDGCACGGSTCGATNAEEEVNDDIQVFIDYVCSH